MKRLTISFAVAAALAAGAAFMPAAAYDVVFDPSNFAQNVQQVSQAIAQVSTLKQQLSNMQQQLGAITGNRGMGGLLSGENNSYLPSDWNSAMSALSSTSSGGYGALASNALQIKQAQSVLSNADMSSLSPQMKQYLDQLRNVSASQQALGQQAYSNASQRVALLQSLTNQINSSTDAKAIMDLQARIQSESTQLQNDQSKLQSVAQLTQAQSVATKQMANELRVQTSGSGSFPILDTSLPSGSN